MSFWTPTQRNSMYSTSKAALEEGEIRDSETLNDLLNFNSDSEIERLNKNK
jgi:hypothetical protein